MLRRLVIPTTLFASVATAQPKQPVPPIVGATELATFSAPAGFIDDPIAYDDQRVAYFVSDATAKAELHVVTLANQQEVIVDLAAVTLHPIGVRLVGNRAFVVGQTEDGGQLGALVELYATTKGKPCSAKACSPPGSVVYKVGPATHVTVVTRDGKPVVAVHTAAATKDGISHRVDLVALDTGKRVATGRPFQLDAKGANKALELRVNHWSDGMSRAIGLKGGEWDKQENQRTPDVEATYDLASGKFVEQHRIEDLFEQRKRYQALADADGRLDFVRLTWDNSAVQVWHAGRPRQVELDQPITNYDPKSLQGTVDGEGSAWFALVVDPVNPDAVARKKADPQYLDVFRAIDGKAVRKARILATGVRHRFGVIGDGGRGFWLLERSSGFDRGGHSLTVYRPQ